jgi:hypothetical protein
VAVLVIMFVVMLVDVGEVFVVFFQSLASASGNLILFGFVEFGAGRGRTGGPFLAGRSISAATSTAATATSTAAGLIRSLGIFTTRPGRTLGIPCRRFVQAKVVDTGQDVFAVQIGIQIQIEIKFARTGLFAARGFTPRLFAPRGTIIAPRSRRAFIAATQVFPTRFLPANFISARRNNLIPYIAASRGSVITSWRRSVIAPRGGSNIPAAFRTTALVAAISATSTTLIAPAAVISSASSTLLIALARTLVPANLRSWFYCFFLVEIRVEVQILLDVRLNHFRTFFKIVVEREAHVVFKAAAFDARRFGLERHARLEFVKRIRRTGCFLRCRAFDNRLLRDRRGSRSGSGNKLRRWWRHFGLGSGGRLRLSRLFRRGKTENGKDARPLALRLGSRRSCFHLRLGTGGGGGGGAGLETGGLVGSEVLSPFGNSAAGETSLGGMPI